MPKVRNPNPTPKPVARAGTPRHSCEAFEAFYKGWRGKTPANAVRLAIEDHNGYNGGDGIADYTHALRQAVTLVEQHAQLVAALEVIAMQTAANGTMAHSMALIAREALDKVAP